MQAEVSRGRQHLAPGADFNYGTRFPTSGPHAPFWSKPGFYERPELAVDLVHALEHGHVVVYYDAPGAEAVETLRAWVSRFGGPWDGLVVVPSPGLDAKVVLTAWGKRLNLETFQAPAAAAFIDAYRGRGPEHPVR